MYSSTPICPPPLEKLFRGEWRHFHRPYPLLPAEVEFHVLSRVLVACWVVGVPACCGGIFRIDKLYSIILLSVMLYVHEHNLESPWPCHVNRGRSCISFAVFWLHLLITVQSRQIAQSQYPVEYCLELAEKYSDGRIHKSEPEQWNGGNVNTVYFFFHQEKYLNQSHRVCLR